MSKIFLSRNLLHVLRGLYKYEIRYFIATYNGLSELQEISAINDRTKDERNRHQCVAVLSATDIRQ